MAAGNAVIGVAGVLTALASFGTEAERRIIDQIEESATNIEISAIRNSPKLSSLDGGSVPIDKQFWNGGLNARVGVQSSDLLWVYLEFGTGASAREILAPYPQEVKDLARQYFITGEGTLRGQPYLYPAFFTERQKFEYALRAILKDLSAKYSK